jgi:hypothetical protein
MFPYKKTSKNCGVLGKMHVIFIAVGEKCKIRAIKYGICIAFKLK